MAHETREFAEEIARAIVFHCPESPVVVNVGAEDGFEAAIIEGSIPGSTVYRFEPNRGTEGLWYGLVVGATDGVATFYRMEDSALSSTYNRTGSIPEEREQVRLDTWAKSADIPRIDALFIDTEGSTLDVLVGAGDLLDSVTFVCAEVQEVPLYGNHPLVPEVESYLASHGLSRAPGGYAGGQQWNRFYARVAG